MSEASEHDGALNRVSSNLGQGSEDSGIFDETVAAYIMRRKGAEQLLVGALAESHVKALRSYLHHVQWTTVGETAVLGKLQRHTSVGPPLTKQTIHRNSPSRRSSTSPCASSSAT